MVQAKLPSAGRISLLHQPQYRRYVAHLLYAPPLQRGRCLVIEDLPTLRNIPVSLRPDRAIKRANLVPGNKPLPVQTSDSTVTVIVPEFSGHCAVVFEY